MTEAEWRDCADPTRMLGLLRGKGGDRKWRLLLCACCRRLWPWLRDERSRDAVATAELYADWLTGEDERRHALAAVTEVADAPPQSSWCRESTLAYVAQAAVEEVMTVDAREGGVPRALFWARAAVAARARRDEWRRQRAQRRARKKRGPGTAGDVPCAKASLGEMGAEAEEAERKFQCDLLRDLFGNPFHPTPLNPAWLTTPSTSLARAAYEERNLPSGAVDGDRLAVLADALEEAGCSDVAILGHLRGRGPHYRGCWLVDALLGKG
jgi:hypothetical protein